MNNEFHYVYTAPTQSERKEIEALRKKYLPKEKREEDTVERLRALDKRVQSLPTMLGIIFGVIGTLIFGLGFTMILHWGLLIWGSLVALIGILPLALAYPVYKRAYAKQEEKYGGEILALSEKLLAETEENE